MFSFFNKEYYLQVAQEHDVKIPEGYPVRTFLRVREIEGAFPRNPLPTGHVTMICWQKTILTMETEC